MAELWAGIDAGKRTHHCVLIDGAGVVVLSTKVSNEEGDLLDLIASVLRVADGREVSWATDLTDGGAALLIALLEAHGQEGVRCAVVRHEALMVRMEVEDLRLLAVVAVG